MTNARDNAINEIARTALGIETLETRKSDSLDFHDMAVWCIKDALERAYEAGRQAAASDTAKHGDTIDLHRHPMYSNSDLRYLRKKGYSDEEILAFWDRDHADGKTPVHHRTKVTFEGIELPSASEAIQHANADPEMDTAITLHGKHYAVPKFTAEHLESQGIAFAYLHDHEMPDGTHRIMTVPVND